jgi:DNA-binding GntR family transcriptional regulator
MVPAAWHAQHGAMGGPDFPDGGCSSSTAEPPDLAELRMLIELGALRKLADRGLTDKELAVSRRLACATVSSARSGDVPGYLEADAVFHLYLLGLTGDPVLTESARMLLDVGKGRRRAGRQLAQRIAIRAGEHGEIVRLLAEDMVSAASEMLRHHVAEDLLGPGET